MKRAPSSSRAQATTGSQCVLLRLGQSFRAVGAIEQKIRAEIFLDLVRHRPRRIGDAVDDGIGQPRQRHFRRDRSRLSAHPIRPRSPAPARATARRAVRRAGVFTGLPSSRTRNAPSLSSTDGLLVEALAQIRRAYCAGPTPPDRADCSCRCRRKYRACHCAAGTARRANIRSSADGSSAEIADHLVRTGGVQVPRPDDSPSSTPIALAPAARAISMS